MNIPECLKKQIECNSIFFDYNGNEWKIEIEKDNSFLKKIIKGNFLIFANDGYGNYLFIKENDHKVYEFFHETSAIFDVDDTLEELIGCKAKAPSTDEYPTPIYKTGEKALLGDKVKFKVWVEFWKGWQEGTVTYVPGISPKKNKYEYEGLKEIEIKGKDITIGVPIDPDTGIIDGVKFIARKEE